MIGSMIVGFLIGLIASAISNRGEHMGCIGKTFVGWLGAFVGQLLFGNWGPMLADTAIVPSVLGAVILLALFGIVIVRNERVLRYWLDISEFSFSYFSFLYTTFRKTVVDY